MEEIYCDFFIVFRAQRIVKTSGQFAESLIEISNWLAWEGLGLMYQKVF